MPPGSGKPLALGMTRLVCACCPSRSPPEVSGVGLKELDAASDVGQSLQCLISGDLVTVLCGPCSAVQMLPGFSI